MSIEMSWKKPGEMSHCVVPMQLGGAYCIIGCTPKVAKNASEITKQVISNVGCIIFKPGQLDNLSLLACWLVSYAHC